MNYVVFLTFFFYPAWLCGQHLSLLVQPVFAAEKIVLEKSLPCGHGDSIAFSTLKFYLGNFQFWKNGRVVFRDKPYRLINLEDEGSLVLGFGFSSEITFDSLFFDLGTDSLTNAAGAMGGDLDPTKGMFWSWQSGYINVKIEGFSDKCPARNREFQLHLGGYLPPFRSVQPVRLDVPRLHGEGALTLQLELGPLFEKMDWEKKHSIMSPSAEAVALSKMLSKSFKIHAN